jgi:flagellar hook-length control protein FliK
MTPTNLPLQPATPATPTSGSVATAPEQGQTADFLLMLGQLVAASVQRSGTSVSPMGKAPLMMLDETVKKDEVNPEEMLAMVAMAVPPPQLPINIDVPVQQGMQSLPAVSVATDAPVQQLMQEVAKEVIESKLAADVAFDEVLQGVGAEEAPESPQGPTSAFQLQQQQQIPAATPHVHSAITRPVHTPVGGAAWADEIGTRVVMMSESGNHTASLKLSPEHLGPLEINITVRDEKASVWFGAAHADTRAAIETALPRLREMFESQGLSLADAGVFREPPREQPVAKSSSLTAEQGDTTDETATVNARTQLGLVDAYA